MNTDKVYAEMLTSINVNTLAGAFLPINPDGLDHACFLIRIINDSDKDVLVAYNGTTERDYIFAGETLQLDFQTNAMPGNYKSLMAKGTIVRVKASAGGTGYVHLAGYYLE